MEPRPSAVRETNFTIGAVATDSDSDEDTRYYFGYLGEDIDAWSACSADAGEFKLFFGKIAGEPKKGCTKNFSLEIAYTGKNSAV